MKNFLLGMATVIILGPVFNAVIIKANKRLEAEKSKQDT